MANIEAAGGRSQTLRLGPGDALSYTFADVGGEDAFAGTFVLESAKAPSRTWKVEASFAATASGSHKNTTKEDQYVRARVLTYTGGPLACTFSVTRAVVALRWVGGNLVAEDGAILMTMTPTGATFPGTVDVAGAATFAEANLGVSTFSNSVTFESAVVVQGTLAVSDSVDLQSAVSAAGNITYTGSSYGFVHETGLYADISFPAVAINPTGPADPPGIEAVTGFLAFDSSATEYVVVPVQVNHDHKDGTDVELHVHIMADSATDPAASPTIEAQTDGVWTASTSTFVSTGATFTGHAGRWLLVTDSGSGSSITSGYVQISTVTDESTVVLASSIGSADDSGIGFKMNADTVALQASYAIIDGAGDRSWDQSTFSALPVKVHYLKPHVDTGKGVERVVTLGNVSTSGFDDSDIIVVKVARVGASANDAYPDDMILVQFDAHYQRDKFGSVVIYGDD